MEIRIYYEDTDCGGVVYYANYLRFLERARTEYLRERGIEVADYGAKGILFVVSAAQLSYKAPARYNDLLDVDLKICNASKASLTFSHKIRRKNDKVLVSDGEITLVCVDSNFKPRPLPEEIRALLVRPA
ncbi:MAG TPA: YbgC/FadM family acyl-CoA thioesterase [Nitrospiria bacterium]|nr:YbgC/FadM family acyl-CoA thioesterase [Nitrospiria bacterium]